MYNETSKPSWNITFWALAGFAAVIGLVLLLGAENAELVSNAARPVS
ncbi:MAG: hypothetical protein AAFO77_04265 [Pseudomonadota bacterium]